MKKFLNNFEEYCLMILFPIMTSVVFIATIGRYLQLFSLPWSEELSRYIMVWMAYLGASVGIKRNAHLGVEVLINMLPKKIQRAAAYVRVVIIIIFNSLIIYYSFQIISHQIRIQQTSPALFIPIWIAYLAVPFGMFLMGVRLIQATFFPQKS